MIFVFRVILIALPFMHAILFKFMLPLIQIAMDWAVLCAISASIAN